ncbi:MAG: indole-3-glycerol phosphate synthase TrpC [Chloroflexota bacterium]|nr:indole-3-glycerol phosphate synthase TrpC [Chloroflexota bacterium]
MNLGTVATGTILDQILTRTAADLRTRAANVPVGELERRARTRPESLSLKAAIAGPPVSIIAEIKRASPSRGIFPVVVEPDVVAASYLDGGAAALSVLTDEPFFQGSLDDLSGAAHVAHRRSPAVPVLRKDFMLDPYQIIEAKAYGADAILLIVAALEDQLLAELLGMARAQGMDALVEVHDEAEMERAGRAGASLIGINNRDLRTFAVDLAVTERLAPFAPPGAVLVGESGVFNAADVARLGRAGVAAVLVGEGLILAPDWAAAVRSLLRPAS